MSDPYVGEIRLVGFAFVPEGWAACDGSLLSIADNDVLFNLLGTTYGGDGVNNFRTPDLRGRAPIHMGTYKGTPYTIGSQGGTENVTLNLSQLPTHSHTIAASSGAALSPSPTQNTFAASGSLNPYETSGPGNTGAMLGPDLSGGLSHDNLMPYVTMNYIIALYGIYPSQN